MGKWTPSKTWFLRPTEVDIPNVISIDQSCLQGSRSLETDRLAEQQSSINVVLVLGWVLVLVFI